MRTRIVLFLLCACSAACAELPPVVDESAGVAANPVANVPNPAASLTTTYDMMKRIDQMQAEVQQLTGKVEEQTFLIEELKKQQKTMYKDFDDRIQTIENKSDTSQPLSEKPVDSATSADSGAVVPPAPAATDQPTHSSQAQDTPPGSTGKSVSATSAQAASPATSADAGSAQVPEAEKMEYQQAYDDLRNGHTDQAITGFNAYITNHPGSAYASNAEYWLGEAYRVNLDNSAARKAFNAVIENHPNSAKVPDALLKLGYIEMEEKNPTKAREILTRVSTEFPTSKAAALAQKKLLVLEKAAP
ncbi:Tol-pal system protein YbgF [Methyloglobulus morosus KoM1]|uniref:Cell division coordinator CpoB n=1 Tax=Methyloglobulus morosus KoM1 TaxID=1116472 RepID=V5C2J3_9GAMM|nr:tol-pal system protein YbgF [Methyloglobulus morosus]ESS72672.1 Tol-pal system protein YbgF [Methyloglobulus morosus KoM1]